MTEEEGSRPLPTKYETGRLAAPASLASGNSLTRPSFGIPRSSDNNGSGEEPRPGEIKLRRGSSVSVGRENSESSMDSMRSYADSHDGRSYSERRLQVPFPSEEPFSPVYAHVGPPRHPVQHSYFDERKYVIGPDSSHRWMPPRRASYDARDMSADELENLARFQSLSIDHRGVPYANGAAYTPGASPRHQYFISDDESGYSSQGNCFSDGESYRYGRGGRYRSGMGMPLSASPGAPYYPEHVPSMPLSDDRRYYSYGDKVCWEERRSRSERGDIPPRPSRERVVSSSSEGQARSAAFPMPAEYSGIFSKARHNKYKEIADILDDGVPVDGRDEFGNTILMIACQNGHKKLAKACLRRGADPNAQNHKGHTALHFCFSFGYQELGEYLIERVGANANVRNIYGLTCYEGLHPSTSS